MAIGYQLDQYNCGRYQAVGFDPQCEVPESWVECLAATESWVECTAASESWVNQ